MQDIHWTKMVHYQQQFQKLSRMLLPTNKQFLTASECELLAWLYLDPNSNTPISLSQNSGMKKEAVSRCLKSLYEKGCICKKINPYDERSYELSLTEVGLSELKKGYEIILQPFYDLWRTIGSDFDQLLKLIDQSVELSSTSNKEELK